jgi:hypothetical protein
VKALGPALFQIPHLRGRQVNLTGHVDNGQIARLACPPQGITPDRAGIAQRCRISFD